MHVPGRKHCGPDYMSRIQEPEMTKKEARMNLIMGFANATSLSNQLENNDITVNDTDIIDGVVKSLSSTHEVEAITFDQVKVEVARDREMMDLVAAITNKLDIDTFPDSLSVYNKYRENLLVLDGVPMYGRRVIIPQGLRKKVLESLHSAHQCPAKMMDRAKSSCFWPGITADIEETRRMCSFCDRNSPSQSAMPPLPLASPEFPFQMLAADFCDIKGKSWLVIADRFSGWLSVHYFQKDPTTSDLIKTLKEYFSTFGVCEHFSSDEGPQFRSAQFREFLKTWGVTQHRVSSAYHPHSNLRAETAVKSSKRIILDNTKSDGSPIVDKLIRAIMNHRNTPDSEYNLSPAQLVFGRPIRDFLPIRPGNFSPSEVWIDNREKRELAHRHRILKGEERWSQHTRSLEPLKVGQNVLIQNQYGTGKMAKKWEKSGMVVEDLGFNKYRIRVDGSGRVTDRNRQFLKKFSPVTAKLPGPCPSQCTDNFREADIGLEGFSSRRSVDPPHPAPAPLPSEDVEQSTPEPEVVEDNIPSTDDVAGAPPSTPTEVSPNRRSTRITSKPKYLNISDTKTKSYDE